MIHDEYAAFVAAFQAEHREMRSLVQTLRLVLDKSRPWSREASNEAVEALTAMEKQLHHHFAQEEEGGYLEQALAAAPRFSAEAATLVEQHSQLLRRANQVVESARQSGSDVQIWERLKSEVQSLIAALLAHETAENQIVQHALSTGEEP